MSRRVAVVLAVLLAPPSAPAQQTVTPARTEVVQLDAVITDAVQEFTAADDNIALVTTRGSAAGLISRKTGRSSPG